MAGYTFTLEKPKDPDAKLDYPMDWSDWLTKIGDTLLTSSWVVAEGTVVIDPAKTTSDDTSAVVWLSGGEPGETVIVTNHITTAAGRADDRSIRFKVKDR